MTNHLTNADRAARLGIDVEDFGEVYAAAMKLGKAPDSSPFKGWRSMSNRLDGGDRLSRLPKPEKKQTTFTMEEAAKELRKSRRWLQDWLRDHPTDAAGIPFYAPLGRTKTFSDTDLERIRATAREEERCRLNSSRPARAKRRITPSAAPTSESTLSELRVLLKKSSPAKFSRASSGQSNVVSMPQRQSPS
jgi:hypothetical protein